ncbi:hypothetical protein CLV35_0253 [Motilibacter peucedani]|uniref:Mobilization protein MobC n=1 Tax=Motilibacter peucedani TaxID=598650 RepID=A0A420XUY7_9ACTN|nr:hypothetical protein [Motilibacter peucedani]RKS80663.1 hypothetical protein CLV35_0253 [Motilibacter peucedani]
MDEASGPAEQGSRAGESPAVGRHREHQFPGRPHRVHARFTVEEWVELTQAAERAGLTPTGYVAASAMATARGTTPPVGSVARDALGELMDARRALTAFATNVNQAAKVLNSGGEAPEWLARAAGLSGQAVRRIDKATIELMRKMP